MKLKTLLIIGIVGLTYNCFGQSERAYSLLNPPSMEYTKAEGKTNTNKNKTGEWRFWRVDGSLISIVSYEDGKRNGNQKIYWDNGTLYSTCNYIKGLKNGTEKVYLKNGYTYEINSFQNDLKNGESKEFDGKGNVKLIENYKNDVLHGISQKFYDGELEESGNYENGNKHGKWMYYDEGILSLEAEYKNGIIDGLWKRRFNSPDDLKNKVKYEYQMLSGKIVNPIKVYEYTNMYSENTSTDPDEDFYETKKYYWLGNIEPSSFNPEHPSGFIKIGEWNMYNEQGNLFLQTLYDEKGEELKNTRLNPEGVIIEINEFKNGVRFSTKEYYNNGTLKSVRIKDVNDRDTIKNYYEDGNIKFYFENLKGTDYYNSGKIKAKKEFIYDKWYLNIISSTEFYENGVIEVVKRYTGLTNNQGNPIGKGTWKYYNEEGKLIKNENYSNGVKQ